MKKRLNEAIFVLLGILIVFGCNEAESIIQPDPSDSQVLLIQDYNTVEKAQEDNSDSFSSMIFARTKLTMPNTQGVIEIKDLSSASVSVTNESTFKDNALHTIKLGTVQLGEIIFDEEINNLPGSSRHLWTTKGGMKIMQDYSYRKFYFEGFGVGPNGYTHGDATNPFDIIAGPTQFTITGSEVIEDVNTIIDIPEKNMILNIESNQEFNINDDLLVELKIPIGGSGDFSSGFIWFFAVNMVEGRARIKAANAITPLERSNKIIIPSEELIDLKQTYPDAIEYVISHRLVKRTGNGQIPLYYKSDGSLYSTLNPSYVEESMIKIKLAD